MNVMNGYIKIITAHLLASFLLFVIIIYYYNRLVLLYLFRFFLLGRHIKIWIVNKKKNERNKRPIISCE